MAHAFVDFADKPPVFASTDVRHECTYSSCGQLKGRLKTVIERMHDDQSHDGSLESTGDDALRVVFLLLPQFSMIAFFSAVEPLRIANRLAGKTLYRWELVADGTASVRASNGMRLVADIDLEDLEAAPLLFVCASFDHERFTTSRMVAKLRQLAARGTTVGALDTGPFVLAAARLLNGRRVTLHWESGPAFRELYPHLIVSDELFEIERGRITCAGGTASMDLMLYLIAERHGDGFARDVSEQLIHERIRARNDHQRMELALRLGTPNSRLVRAVSLMEKHIDAPLAQSDLAARVGVSLRQLERLFRAHLGFSPNAYYRRLKLGRGRELITQTDMSVLNVALACGFGSATAFSRAYTSHFGCTPRDDRRGTT